MYHLNLFKYINLKKYIILNNWAKTAGKQRRQMIYQHHFTFDSIFFMSQASKKVDSSTDGKYNHCFRYDNSANNSWNVMLPYPLKMNPTATHIISVVPCLCNMLHELINALSNKKKYSNQ